MFQKSPARDTRIVVRLTGEEATLVDKEADRREMTRSELVRSALADYVKRPRRRPQRRGGRRA